MSKLGCECGGTIYDQTDFIPYKGDIIRDQDYELVFDTIAEDVNSFIEAVLHGKRDEWIRNYFLPGYPHVVNSDVVSDIISRHVRRCALTIYQCLQCGSIKIQSSSHSNTFNSFAANEWQKGNRSILESEEGRVGT